MPFEDLYGAKRQIWRVLLLFVMCLQLFSLLYGYIKTDDANVVAQRLRQHAVDADEYHQKREDVGKARAAISVSIVNAIASGRTFTEKEKKEISNLWNNAEFDKIQEKFLDGKNE